MSKGDKPYGSREVLTKLQQLWSNIGPWKLTPLARGYFEFSFSSYEDLRSVWAKGTLNLKPGLLRLFEWSKDFNARTQRQTHAQVSLQENQQITTLHLRPLPCNCLKMHICNGSATVWLKGSQLLMKKSQRATHFFTPACGQIFTSNFYLFLVDK